MILQCLLLASAPFALVLLVPWMHAMDLATFLDWSQSWTAGPSEIYRQSSCNYPPLGAVFSAGALSILKAHLPSLDFWELMNRYRLLLAIFDAAAALLLFLLLSRLKIPGAWAWSWVLTLLPSTWAGTSVWGQIDGITQLFLLAWILCWLRAARGRPSLGWGALGSLWMGCALLTKQLALFAVPAFLVWGAVLCARAFRRDRSHGLSMLGITLGAVAGVLLVPDFFIQLPTGYHSSIGFILGGERSDHYRRIAMNGFNLWTLFVDDPRASSGQPVLPAFAGFSFLHAGVGMLALTLALAGLALLRALQRCLPREQGALLLLFFAITELSVNVWMTGTHERYLIHFYPFAIVAMLCLGRKRWAAILAAGGAGYGAYILFILHGSASGGEFYPVSAARLTALVHLGLWGAMMMALFLSSRGRPAPAIPRFSLSRA